MNISPSKSLDVIFNKGSTLDQKRVSDLKDFIQTLAKLSSMRFRSLNETLPESATALVGELEILIPMAGLIDKAEESKRLHREIAKLTKEIERAEAKLQNSNFIYRAPKDVVTKKRVRLEELQTTQEKLKQQLEQLLPPIYPLL